MPGKNAIKTYVENGYYHVYNRGVEKRLIFQDQQDYHVYLGCLKEYLSPKAEKELSDRLSAAGASQEEKYLTRKLLALNNFHDDITLLAYCLMPNHFHFFLKQKSAGALDRFMRSMSTRYVSYFNRKYNRVGPLYQSRYKAVLINSEAQYLHISRYIHKQAIALQVTGSPQPSSFPDYIGKRGTSWVHPEEILEFFSDAVQPWTYERFVEDWDDWKDDDDF